MMNEEMVLTNPTKKRTATVSFLTLGYCIHALRTAIRRLKLLAVEKTPMKRSNGWCCSSGADLSSVISTTSSKPSDVGKPLAKTEISSKSPDILTSLTSQGSRLCNHHSQK